MPAIADHKDRDRRRFSDVGTIWAAVVDKLFGGPWRADRDKAPARRGAP